MRFLPLFLLAIAPIFVTPAHAVLQGTADRNPNGLRRSVVSIENSAGELCSGAVIAPDLVLTAAHCVMDKASYRVMAFGHSFKSKTLKVIAIAVHPAFVPGTVPRKQPGVDLAIVKLEQPLGSEFSPFDPKLAGKVESGDTVTIAGFGVLAEKQRNSARVLRQTDLISVGLVELANRVMIVADRDKLAETTGAGACRGDSGGPILVGSQSDYRLFGIVSWSSGALRTTDQSACGGLTAVTPVNDHIGWIVEGAQKLNGARDEWAGH
ncbi:S1 family peptidase [Microvirga terricola]|uniref:Trypsin-like serine protease n=1 Tax=Microvirga terricola TaxID=2719797 RepID=A0ABX0VAL3_9HYPH|nr:trypsin-like serine protease [Microvirga terricola]NIX76892.1 trypsin-like serine protease [Microvirga terricola]